MNAIRDPKTGHFLPGHPALPHQGVRQLNAAFRQCATQEHVKELFQLVWEMCHDEDKRIAHDACVTLLNRLLGKPTERIEVEAQTTQLADLPTEYLLAELLRLQQSSKTPSPIVIDCTPQESPYVAPGQHAEALANQSHQEDANEPQEGLQGLEDVPQVDAENNG
jgi:hypothetical protein